MMYSLHDLLAKMGAPEVKEKGQMRWHYFDADTGEISGFAEIRLIDGGERLIAELSHVRHNYEDDTGRFHASYTESFYLHAERSGIHYNVTTIAFDGEAYPRPQKAVIELGLSIFHARALDISILMVEQAFNKQDILRPVQEDAAAFKGVPVRRKTQPMPAAIPRAESWGVVVPFRPRAELRA